MTPEQATELLALAHQNHTILADIQSAIPWIIGGLLVIIFFK